MNGNYNDAGPNGINGTNNGSTSTTNKFGTANSSMNFLNPSPTATTVVQWATHPVNSNVSFSGTQDFTIAFMFYLNSPWVHTGGFYDNNLNYGGPGIWIWQNPTPIIQFNYKNSSLASTTIPLATWKHVACVRNAGALRIYIDGVLNGTGTEGTQAPVYTYPARFGTMFYQPYPHYNGLNGKLDELRIYNRALSAAEIIGLANTTLPSQLGNFSAVKQTTGIRLNWETLSEQNTSHFEIERSADGNNYTTIGTINAAGNSTDRRNYSFMDNNPLLKNNFYRLKMADLNGVFTYSRIVVIKNDNNLLSLQLFPNPVSDLLQIQLPASREMTSTLRIMDATGKQVLIQSLQTNEGRNALSIPVSHLITGTYYLVIDNEEGRQSKTFIKQ